MDIGGVKVPGDGVSDRPEGQLTVTPRTVASMALR